MSLWPTVQAKAQRSQQWRQKRFRPKNRKEAASLWPTIVATQESPQEVTSLLETVLATQLQRCQMIPWPTLQATRFLGILCLYAGCFAFWCLMLFPFILRGFCETSCFSCHANVLMFGLDKALLLLFFMPDVNPLFPQQCSRTSIPQSLKPACPNHRNPRLPLEGWNVRKNDATISFPLENQTPRGVSKKACC